MSAECRVEHVSLEGAQIAIDGLRLRLDLRIVPRSARAGSADGTGILDVVSATLRSTRAPVYQVAAVVLGVGVLLVALLLWFMAPARSTHVPDTLALTNTPGRHASPASHTEHPALTAPTAPEVIAAPNAPEILGAPTAPERATAPGVLEIGVAPGVRNTGARAAAESPRSSAARSSAKLTGRNPPPASAARAAARGANVESGAAAPQKGGGGAPPASEAQHPLVTAQPSHPGDMLDLFGDPK